LCVYCDEVHEEFFSEVRHYLKSSRSTSVGNIPEMLVIRIVNCTLSYILIQFFAFGKKERKT